MYKVLTHSSIRIDDQYIMYFDPYDIKKESHDADYIFITHSHYDHFSIEDIKKIIQKKTILFLTLDLKEYEEELMKYTNSLYYIKPYESYQFDHLQVETIPAYNMNKPYHTKDKQWVGYLITTSKRYYIAGDTSINEDNQKVKCDIAFLPVGGTYTMDYQEAAKLASCIQPQIAVATHYGSVVGTKEDAISFCQLLDDSIQGICEMGQ